MAERGCRPGLCRTLPAVAARGAGLDGVRADAYFPAAPCRAVQPTRGRDHRAHRDCCVTNDIATDAEIDEHLSRMWQGPPRPGAATDDHRLGSSSLAVGAIGNVPLPPTFCRSAVRAPVCPLPFAPASINSGGFRCYFPVATGPIKTILPMHCPLRWRKQQSGGKWQRGRKS